MACRGGRGKRMDAAGRLVLDDVVEIGSGIVHWGKCDWMDALRELEVDPASLKNGIRELFSRVEKAKEFLNSYDSLKNWDKVCDSLELFDSLIYAFEGLDALDINGELKALAGKTKTLPTPGRVRFSLQHWPAASGT